MLIPFHLPQTSIDTWMFDNRRIEVKTKLCLRPRRCYLSNKWIWFKRCEVVISMVNGSGNPVYETYWCDPREFLLNELKR